ncbi:MAG: adenosine kinase [Rikenellaceae bacterium]|nr:adenosine kinase [Rikenellaceae bacterium]
MKKVIGIGNALTDMLINLDSDSRLSEMGLARGSMSLVDSDLQREISGTVAGLPNTMSLGGSAANTIRALACLGGSAGFIGKTGKDEAGDFYKQALETLGIEPVIMRGQAASGRCLSLVSTDGERTMVTYLGAALELTAEELSTTILEGYNWLYIEGYLVQNHALIEAAAALAKQNGLKVAIDLASFNVVEENLEFLRRIIGTYVDLVFANEDEAQAFTGNEDPYEAATQIAEMCELAVVKIGRRGALIQESGHEVVQVGIEESAQRVDTTGAGDFYAAGFMYGLCKGLSMRQCGTIGAITAGHVIEIVGTTLSEETWKRILLKVQEVEHNTYLL